MHEYGHVYKMETQWTHTKKCKKKIKCLVWSRGSAITAVLMLCYLHTEPRLHFVWVFIHVWSLQKHNPATELRRPGDSAGRVMVIYTGHLAVQRLSHSLHGGPRLAALRQALQISTSDTLLLLSHWIPHSLWSGAGVQNILQQIVHLASFLCFPSNKSRDFSSLPAQREYVFIWSPKLHHTTFMSRYLQRWVKLYDRTRFMPFFSDKWRNTDRRLAPGSVVLHHR